MIFKRVILNPGLPLWIFLLFFQQMPSIARAQHYGNQTRWRSNTNIWTRHTVDDSSKGADGVKLADANGDSLQDIVTGWEEGGVVRIYLNPGTALAKQTWPKIEVGQAVKVEDAVFVDVNGDEILDVVSSTEGENRSLYFHLAPGDASKYVDGSQWSTRVLPVSKGKMQWMFAQPVDVDGKAGIDIVAAGKHEDAEIGWLEAPAQMDQLDRWKWHPLASIGWVMSIIEYDLNKDGLDDIVYSDRRDENRGVHWFQKAGAKARKKSGKAFLPRGYIGGRDHELLFMAIGDATNDGSDELVVATRATSLIFLKQNTEGDWKETELQFPPGTGAGKGIAIGDMD